MPKRNCRAKLQSAAVIVLSAAGIFAALVGIPLLMTYYGLRLDAGIIVNAFAALGALSAAVAAVWVATSDRVEAAKQSKRSEKAQAGLVMVEPRRTASGLEIIVRNYGTLPILSVELVSFDVEANPQLFPLVPDFAYLPVVPPDRDVDRVWNPKEEFMQEFVRAFYFRTSNERNPLLVSALEGVTTSNSVDSRIVTPRTINDETRLTATILFTNAHGNRWRLKCDAPAKIRADKDDEVVRYARRICLEREP